MVIFISLGIIASLFQLIILREFSFSIAKHELNLVLGAGFWVIFCSFGSIVKVPKKIPATGLPALAAFSFAFSIYLIHSAKTLTGLKYYETARLGSVIGLSLFLIGPTAFIIGSLFKQFVQNYFRNNPLIKTHNVRFFAFEAIGFFLGGLAFSLFFSDYTNPLIFTLLPLILLPSLNKLWRKIYYAILIVSFSLISVLGFNFILEQEFGKADILINQGSAYGPITVIRKAGITNLFSAGSLLATSEDQLPVEEFIHMSLSAIDPEVSLEVLFIGAPLSGQISEITKYKLQSLDCLQINPLLWRLIPDLPAGIEQKDKINFITQDPRIYLRKTQKKYDVILMHTPPPANLALNRYFTEDFFRLIAKNLKAEGIFSFNIPSKREILSPQFINFNSSIINAIDKIFLYRLISPSDTMLIIASNQKEIADQYLFNNFSITKPETKFFTIYHFKDNLNQQMRNYTESMLDKNIPPNTDLHPTGFLNYFQLEQTKFYPNLKLDIKKTRSGIVKFLAGLGILIIIISYLSRKFSCLLDIAGIGFTSISLSSIIFILFQLFCAGLYWKLGLLIGLFMVAVTAGVLSVETFQTKHIPRLFSLYLCWIIIISILLLNLKSIGQSNHAEYIFYLYALICGFLTGSAYPLLSQNLLKHQIPKQEIPIIIYSADLSGAFLGTLACGLLLIPFLGIPNTLLTLIFLNALLALKNLNN